MINRKRFGMLGLFLMATAGRVFAAAPGGDQPWATALQDLLNIVQSGWLSAIAALMVIGGGIMIAVSEGQGVKRLVWIIVGLGVAIGASQLVAALGFGDASAVLPLF